MAEREPINVEREKTHGDFKRNAVISQGIKRIVRHHEIHPIGSLSDAHKECLDMIALKISRILSGKAMTKDHWDDIAGYAKLGSEACE